ncbi:Methyltransferase type 11 [Macleaya cordata]|uniref:Methyltransferase type 11 n=1 Tax=Macleaya cordata TaxID=56857 RepID=A0A200R077_MACCD|nr:Methyltransferase type 11 [Macleaya cordata]
MAGFFDDLEVDDYLEGRIKYVDEWYFMLSVFTPDHARAWDVGTGNGVAAIGIAEYYEQVIATDISEAELEQAVPHPKVTYIHTPLSMTDEELISKLGGEGSIDLVTVAQAIHLFDLPRFYSLVNRLLKKPGGVIAVWGYNNIFGVGPPLELAWKQFHETALPYRHPHVRDISDGLKTLPFPFEAVGIGAEGDPMPLLIPTRSSFEGFLGVLRSWTEVVAAKDQGVDLLSEEAVKELHSAWGTDLIQPIIYKTYMIAGEPRL